MEIIDDVPFDEAIQKVGNGEYVLIVDRGMATRAFGNSGSVCTNLAFLPYISVAVGIALLFFDWKIAILAFIFGILSFRILRYAAINWVREHALVERGLYEAFAKHRIIWFTPLVPNSEK